MEFSVTAELSLARLDKLERCRQHTEQLQSNTRILNQLSILAFPTEHRTDHSKQIQEEIAGFVVDEVVVEHFPPKYLCLPYQFIFRQLLSIR
jgi:hypothetical protein